MAVDLFKTNPISIFTQDISNFTSPGGSADDLISRLEADPPVKDVRTISQDIPGTANAVDTNDRTIPFAFNSQTADATIGSITQPIDDLYIGRGTKHTGAAQTTLIHGSDGQGVSLAGDSLAIQGGLSTDDASGGSVLIYTSPSTPIPFASVKSYWKMDTTGTRADVLGVHDLTDNGATPTAAGKISNAADFTPASSQYLSAAVTAGSTLQINDSEFTWAGWVYLDSVAATQVIASQRNDAIGSEAWMVAYNVAVNRFRVSVFDVAGAGVNVNADNFGAPSINTWYFLQVFRTNSGGTNTINVRVNNGTADSASTVGLVIPAITAKFRIGAMGDAAGTGAQTFLDGRVDEVGWWTSSLATASLDYLYNSGSGRTYAVQGDGTPNTAYKRFDVTSDGTTTLYQGASATKYFQFDPTNQRVYLTGNGNIPSGVTGSGVVVHNGSANPFILITAADSDAAALSLSVINTTECSIVSSRTGSGTFVPLKTYTNATLRETLSTAGLFRWHAYGAGTLTTDGSGNITAVSDERLKDVQALFTAGLRELLQIHPVLYKWKACTDLDTNGIYPGFLAQEVQSVIPETIGINPVGQLTLQDRGLIGALVNAVQELSARVTALEAK